MNKVTEIIPDDIPEWAKKAIENGNFFTTAIEKVESVAVDREEFEKWASEPPRMWYLARRTYNTTKYVMRHVQCAWEVMQWITEEIEK